MSLSKWAFTAIGVFVGFGTAVALGLAFGLDTYSAWFWALASALLVLGGWLGFLRGAAGEGEDDAATAFWISTAGLLLLIAAALVVVLGATKDPNTACGLGIMGGIGGILLVLVAPMVYRYAWDWPVAAPRAHHPPPDSTRGAGESQTTERIHGLERERNFALSRAYRSEMKRKPWYRGPKW